ncbi:MAG TPA: ATP-binding protein [Solirubrobacteraceae bacterium]|nr:ATP-binding protein [Solirubrobacteraceae bacterium]
MSGASDSEAREFAAAFRSFLEWVHSDAAERERNEVVALVVDHLGEDRSAKSVVSRSLAPFEHVNLQTALNAWSREPGRDAAVHGFTIPPHHPPATLQQLLTGHGMPWLRLSAPAFADLPNGPASSLACLERAVLLVNDADGRYVVMVTATSDHGPPSIDVEIAGLEVEAAQAVHARLAELRHQLNVYRGHVVDVGLNPMGGVSLSFGEVPHLARDDVVLPEAVLGRVERHALGIAAHRDALLGAGQHLKRGLLLYGPPGTGKTHTTRYLVGKMIGYTRFVLTGRALQAIGGVTEFARDLQPAVMVLEDVDLVAEHRGFGPGSSPVLFDLLDAMDGAAPDADLLFVLTTNRADLLEPALAARPGRVDVAIEIDLPDEQGRHRLLALYGRSLPLRLSESETREVVERMDGVTASFVKELLRRAMLESLHDSPSEPVVTAAHTARALDDLLDADQRLTRSLLGVGTDPETLAAGGGAGTLPPSRPRPGWAAYGRLRTYPG